MAEKTLAQVYGAPAPFSDDRQPRSKIHSAKAYKKYREMREDPTINFARRLIVAPLVKAGWSIECTEHAPEGAKELVEEILDPVRIPLVKQMLEGCIDFGWQPFELVWETQEDGTQQVKKFKALLQDITWILVDEKTGAFEGLEQDGPEGEITLSSVETLCVALDVEGTDWYGYPTMRTAETPYDTGKAVAEQSLKYDKKIAGVRLKVEYPVGKTMYNGILTDNYEIARKLEAALEGSGLIAIPKDRTPYGTGEDDETGKWVVEFMSDDSNARGQFTESDRRQDALKVRAFGLPERSVLEGEFGTKAESEAHAVFAIVGMELNYELLLIQLNWHIVNRIVRMNYGPGYDGTVYIKPAPLSDAAKAFLQELYQVMLANPDAGLIEQNEIDIESIRDRVGVPTREKESILEPEPDKPVRTVLDPAQVAALLSGVEQGQGDAA